MTSQILDIIVKYLKSILELLQNAWNIFTRLWTGITWCYDIISNSMTTIGKYIGWITEQSSILGMIALANFTLLAMLFLINRLGDGN